ncbi:MAG: peptide ABC transporter substrate-binding protein [Lachnospiraceae bacterium]|nr:peptide ABC transporter substrate-binding protein [Lachnospiraceae bacterium]
MKRKDLRRVLGAILTAVTLCGCSRKLPEIKDTAAGESESSIYRIMYYNEITTLNYLQTGTQVDYALCANLVDCLVDYDSYGNIIPGLAESWTSNVYMTEWTFKIRPGVMWVDCDGKEVAEVTADDWVTTAHYVNDAANDSASQYMYATGALVKNAQKYYDYTDYLIKSDGGTRTTDEEGNPIEAAERVSPGEIGVVATDRYTLKYTLEQPCPFFLSVLSYSSYMPVNGDFLNSVGDMFGRSKENILYNGAYRLSEYIPQERRTLKKNESYWDKDKVYLTEIDARYRSDVLESGPEHFLNGDVDKAFISSEVMKEWMEDPEKADQVHSMRPDIAYSYFYCFNYDPEFDAVYEPENWRKAVMNENFRKALALSLNMRELAAVNEPYNTELLLQKTITPATFVSSGGRDYTDFDAFEDMSMQGGQDVEKARAFRDAAKAELSAEGVTFPVKVLMPYNPTTVNWDTECAMAGKMLEDILGKDFVEVQVVRGPDSGFLAAVRRSGKYAFMLCNWGADYADPETYTEPFSEGNTYMFWDTVSDPAIKEIFEEYVSILAMARTTYDTEERYELFSQAEALLIEHAIIVPYRVSNGEGYVADRLSQFEGEFAPYGLARERYKGKMLHEKSMSIEEFNEAYEKWELERAASMSE